MQIHKLPVTDALASLRTTLSGLSNVEAQRRLKEYGANSLPLVSREPIWVRFLKEFTQLFSLILWIAAGLAFIAEWWAPGQGMARLGITVVVVILVSGIFSFWQEHRVEQTLAALSKLLPQQVDVLREGKTSRLPREQLVAGDIVLLAQGDHVPADCRLIEGFGVKVNNAAITGESLPQTREAGISEEDDQALGMKNILLAGTSIAAGQAKALVFATGSRTEFGKIAHLTQSSDEATSPLRQEISHLSRLIGIFAVLIGLAFFVIGRLTGIPLWDAFIFAIGIIIAMVPEGLLPTLTLALVLATQRMAKRNVLIRHLPSVETLGSTTVICTDKTGTLTKNVMTVKQVVLGGVSYSASDQSKRELLVKDYRPFFMVARFCHDLREGEQHGKQVLMGDPMESALVEMASQAIPLQSDYRKLDEIPFDADRMRQSTVHETPEGPVLLCKGAPEMVATLCTRILTNGRVTLLQEEARAGIRTAQEAMALQGMRVLALAYSPLSTSWQHNAAIEEDLIFAGLAGIEDPPRPEVPEAIRKCYKAGIRVIMVTGDHPSTAQAIAREIGLVRSDKPLVVSGEKLRGFSDSQLWLALDETEVIFARVTADQKMRIVDALKQKQHVVAVTGDGVNDAPALKNAHIGIAMGITGTDVAREAADMVLLDDNFASIVNAIEEGRAIFENIRKFLTYILAHNVPELIPYLAFMLFKIPLPLTPIQILSVDMGTDSLTALGLGIEKPDPKIMERPPRSRHERLFNWPLVLRAYFFLGLIEAVAAMACFFFILQGGGWQYGQKLAMDDPLYLQATTACLSSIIVMQIVNVFLCRSRSRSIFSMSLLGNPLILWGVLLEIVLLLFIGYTPLGNAIFGTAPISGTAWLFILPFAFGLMFLEELRKWLARNLTNFFTRQKPDSHT